MLGMERVKPAIKVEIPNLGETLAETIKNTKTKILPEASTSIIVEGDVLRLVKGKIDHRHARFDFRYKNGIVVQRPSLYARVDVSGPDDLAAKRKTLEGVEDALIIVEWTDSQPETQVRFILMLLRWVGDNIAERVGLIGDYGEDWEKTFVDSLPRRRVKFELR